MAVTKSHSGYLHQVPLNDSIKRLYMLGKKSPKQPKDDMGVGVALGNLRQAMKKPDTRPEWEKQEAALLAKPVDGADRAHAQYTANLQPDTMVHDLAQKYKNQELAENTAFRGQYSSPGLEATYKESAVNGRDRFQLKQMARMGMANSVVPEDY